MSLYRSATAPWFNFGTGALGDMAIHNMAPAFYARALGAPTAVDAMTSRLKKEFQAPPATIPRSIGHRLEWIQACKDHKPEDARAGLAYSGLSTEALLVSNLALRLQKRIEWDAAKMRASNAAETDELIHKRDRAGFGIGS